MSLIAPKIPANTMPRSTYTHTAPRIVSRPITRWRRIRLRMTIGAAITRANMTKVVPSFVRRSKTACNSVESAAMPTTTAQMRNARSRTCDVWSASSNTPPSIADTTNRPHSES